MQVFLPLYINETALQLSNKNDYTVYTYIHLLKIYCTPLVSVLGLILNSLVLVITNRAELKFTSIQPYIIALACCDMVFLVMLILEWSRHITSWDGGAGLDLYSTQGFCQGMTYITAICVAVTGWLVFCIQFDRFVFHFTDSYSRKYVCTRIKAKLITATICTIAIVVYLNISLLYTVNVFDSYRYCSPIYRFKPAVGTFERVEMAVILGGPYLGLLIVITLAIIKLCSRRFKAFNTGDSSSQTDKRHQPATASNCHYKHNNTNITTATNHCHGRTSSGVAAYKTPRTTSTNTINNNSQGPPLLMFSIALSIFYILFTMPAFVVNITINVLSEPSYVRYLTLQLLFIQQFLQGLLYYRFALNFFVYLIGSRSFREETRKLIVYLVCCECFRSCKTAVCCRRLKTRQQTGSKKNGREIEERDGNYITAPENTCGNVPVTEV